jgi:hypothetical protein
MLFELRHQAPPLTESNLERIERLLRAEFDYPSLPTDYKEFLLRHNGGFVSPGHIDDADGRGHSEEIIFDTPLRWARADDKPVRPCLVMFFCAEVEGKTRTAGSPQRNLYELAASNRHSKIDRDVLPRRMVSIAKCSHPDAADMLCLSVSDNDFGCVYYHYEMWHYPANFHGAFYRNRERELAAAIGPQIDEFVCNSAHPRHEQVVDALKRVPFVKVAESFGSFLTSLTRVPIAAGYPAPPA